MRRAIRLLMALSGIVAALFHYHHAARWAYVETTGEPKFEVPTWWMVGECIILGLIVALLIFTIGSGIIHIRRCRAEQSDPSTGEQRADG